MTTKPAPPLGLRHGHPADDAAVHPTGGHPEDGDLPRFPAPHAVGEPQPPIARGVGPPLHPSRTLPTGEVHSDAGPSAIEVGTGRESRSPRSGPATLTGRLSESQGVGTAVQNRLLATSLGEVSSFSSGSSSVLSRIIPQLKMERAGSPAPPRHVAGRSRLHLPRSGRRRLPQEQPGP